jgi:predicted ribosomally synthesized peptide with nif11-like leader
MREFDMSIENATNFLEKIAQRNDLRSHFLHVRSPQEFATVAGDLGFHFTPEELKEVVKTHSAGVNQRRHTGVWEWLRTVPWVEKTGGDLKSEDAAPLTTLAADLPTPSPSDEDPIAPPPPVLDPAPEASR